MNMDRNVNDALSLDDLEKVTGGMGSASSLKGTEKRAAKPGKKTASAGEQLMRMACTCGEVFEANVMASSATCPACGKTITLAG